MKKTSIILSMALVLNFLGNASFAAFVTFPTVSTMVSSTGLAVGDVVMTTQYNAPILQYWQIVSAGTGTADGGSYINLTGISGQAKQIFKENVINVLSFGATPDYSSGTGTDNTSVFSAVRDYINSRSDISDAYVPDGSYAGTLDSNSKNNQVWTFGQNATIALVSGITNSNTITIRNSTGFVIKGGKSTSYQRNKRLTNCSDSVSSGFIGHTAYFATKSTYSGNAIYDKAGFYLEDVSKCFVKDCEAYNIEGAGISIVGTSDNNKLSGNYCHDNVTGILHNGNNNNNNTISDNRLIDNNVSSGSGCDGLFINATNVLSSSGGHDIYNNRLINNGEHGSYIQCNTTSYHNNIANNNTMGGHKFAKCRDFDAADNDASNNDTNIQLQSGIKNFRLSGGLLKNASSQDIICVYNKELDPNDYEELTIDGVKCVSTAVTWAIVADADTGLEILNCDTEGGIMVGSSCTSISDATIANNKTKSTLRLTYTNEADVNHNQCETLFACGTNNRIKFDNNDITDMVISRKDVELQAFESITNNRIYSSMTASVSPYELFNGQDAWFSGDEGFNFSHNKIKTAGIRVMFIPYTNPRYDSVIVGNMLDTSSGDMAFNVAFANSTVSQNICASGTSLGTFTLTNCTVLGNTGTGTFNGSGNSVANNK